MHMFIEKPVVKTIYDGTIHDSLVQVIRLLPDHKISCIKMVREVYETDLYTAKCIVERIWELS